MGLEIRQLVVKSTVVREQATPSDKPAHVTDLRMLREQLLEENRKLAVSVRDGRRER
jgi:hypothetical protein